MAPARPRAHVVVTGSELVRGELTDRNGPFLAAEALALGFEPARITVVGDTEEELADALAEGLQADLCVVSGGLGPTHDDRTIELLARAAGVGLEVDRALEAEIEGISRGFAERLHRPYADFSEGVTKQATLPVGALSLGLAGTAPGVLLPLGGDRVAVALPGPPQELRRLWPRAVETDEFRRLARRASPPERRVLRFYGASESAVARALAEAGGDGDGDGVVATICAREFEIHVDLVVEPEARARAVALEERLLEPLTPYLFARDDQPVEALVLELARQRGLRLATAESCTGGLVAARLTDVAGSSDVFLGGVVAYANEVKEAELGVPAEVLAAHGAVSVTGVAGPGGGSPEKPVGLVYLHAAGPDGGRSEDFSYGGDRETIRRRATVSALHLLRALLSQS